MSLHAQYRRDRETSWINPTSDVEIEVSQFDPRQPNYINIITKLTKPVRKLVEQNLLSPEKDREYAIRAFVKCCVKGWRTGDKPEIQVKNGEWLVYTEDNAVRVFSEYPAFYNDVVELARDITTFQISDDEVKN